MPTHVITINGDGVNPSTGDAQIPIYSKKVVLTDAQIKSLASGTEIELIPAPGANKLILIHRVVLSITFSGTGSGYTGINAGSFIQINPSNMYLSAIVNGDSNGLTAFLYGNDGTVNRTAILKPAGGGYDNTVGIPFESIIDTNNGTYNTPCTIGGWNNGAPISWTGGNAANTLTVTVFYSIVDF